MRRGGEKESGGDEERRVDTKTSSRISPNTFN